MAGLGRERWAGLGGGGGKADFRIKFSGADILCQINTLMYTQQPKLVRPASDSDFGAEVPSEVRL